MKKFILTIAILLSFGVVKSQINNVIKFGEPIQTSITTEIPVIFENFSVNEIGAISLKFTYDTLKFSFLSYNNISPILQTGFFLPSEFNNKISLGWFNVIPQTVPDTLINVVFHNINNCSDFIWDDSIPFTACDISYDDSTGIPISLNLNCIDTNICNPIIVAISTNDEENNPKIYSYNQIIYIENSDYVEEGIYDMCGRQIHNAINLQPNQKYSVGLWDKGIYIVKLYKQNKAFVQKVLVTQDYY